MDKCESGRNGVVIQPGVAEEQEEYGGTEGMRDGGLKSVIMATRLAPADEAAWEGPASRDPVAHAAPVIPTLCVAHGPSCPGAVEGVCS
jgi:hypothetical protein